MSGYVREPKTELENNFDRYKSEELLLIRTNGLENRGFLFRYEECRQVFFFSNAILMGGKEVMSEFEEEIRR